MRDASSSFQDSFSKTFKECLLSFSFDIAGLVAGGILASQTHIFSLSSWIIALYPAILSARGMISGIFTGRLSTALHLGTVNPKLFGNTRKFYKLIELIIATNLVISIFMSSIAMLLGFFLWGIEVTDFATIIILVMATMALGLTISFFNMLVSFLSFKKGLDPDVVVYPIMSTTADIIITGYYVIAISLFFLFSNIGKNLIILIDVTYLCLVAFIFLRNLHDGEFMRDLREVLLTLLIVAFIVNITGTFLDRINLIVKSRREIYTVYPALIDTVGDVGSVVGSITTTRLALGLIDPIIQSLERIKKQIFSSWTVSIIIFLILSILSALLNGILEISTFISYASTLLITNFIAIPAMIIISYAISISAFKRGFDPDNFVIPIESSLADNITTIALLAALLLH